MEVGGSKGVLGVRQSGAVTGFTRREQQAGVEAGAGLWRDGSGKEGEL